MTLDEFLDAFIKKAGLPASARTPDGVRYGSFRRVAVACPQGSDPHQHYLGPDGGGWIECRGWLLEEAPDTPKYRGGEYTVTRHA